MTTIFENSETADAIEASEAIIDADGVVTLAMVELLTNPEYGGSWLQELAEELNVELDDAQLNYLEQTVARTLDQLAIPFVKSLPARDRGIYEEHLRMREAAFNPQSAPDVKVYTLDDVTDAGVVYDLLGE